MEITNGDQEKAKFLQKVLGYGLGGDTRLECMFIFYGATTCNGKGTLCESVLKVIGHYGCTSKAETIGIKPNKSSRSPSEDVARLAGVPLVTVAGRAGHARTSTTTDNYSHFLKSYDKTAAEKLEQMFE